MWNKYTFYFCLKTSSLQQFFLESTTVTQSHERRVAHSLLRRQCRAGDRKELTPLRPPPLQPARVQHCGLMGDGWRRLRGRRGESTLTSAAHQRETSKASEVLITQHPPPPHLSGCSLDGWGWRGEYCPWWPRPTKQKCILSPFDVDGGGTVGCKRAV